MEEILVYFALKYNGDFDLILKALEEKEYVEEEDKKRMLSKVKSKYTTIISEDYPDQLKEITCPPFVLFYYGDLRILNKKCIGMIGTRHPSCYGRKATQTLISQLSHEEITIISGMAIGIDGECHREAMRNHLRTCAVLGSGIDYCYPKKHEEMYRQMKENELVISEYPLDMMPRKDCFPKRNRLISGLSSKVVVMEAHRKSGTMITVGFALEQGKDVLAVPGRIDDQQGCNELIAQGAKIVLKGEDIIEELY
jgi:DNA processing protein